MAEYNWTKKSEEGVYTVMVDEVAKYGYFEHNKLGEDQAGGLWFELDDGKLSLTDYDGVFSLPVQVSFKLREMGLVVGPEFD